MMKHKGAVLLIPYALLLCLFPYVTDAIDLQVSRTFGASMAGIALLWFVVRCLYIGAGAVLFTMDTLKHQSKIKSVLFALAALILIIYPVLAVAVSGIAFVNGNAVGYLSEFGIAACALAGNAVLCARAPADKP